LITGSGSLTATITAIGILTQISAAMHGQAFMTATPAGPYIPPGTTGPYTWEPIGANALGILGTPEDVPAPELVLGGTALVVNGVLVPSPGPSTIGTYGWKARG
jgi:hypothetical protein